MKLKKLSFQKDTLLPLDASETVNIAGGVAVPTSMMLATCPATDSGPRCNGTATCACTATCATACNQATCATCATHCGTCATNCGTCATCGCPVTHLSDCRCPSLAIQATCYC